MVYLGFPFETITSSTVRNAYMADALAYFIPGPVQPLAFTGINRLPNGSVQLLLNGSPGYNVQLLSSTNLFDWTVLANLHNPTGSLQFTNAPAPGLANQFYRARYP